MRTRTLQGLAMDVGGNLMSNNGSSNQTQTYGEGCPINCVTENVTEKWYLSEIPSPDAVAITVQEIETVCDETPETTSVPQIDCEKLLAALRAMGMNVESLNGLAGCSWSNNNNDTTVRGLHGIKGLGNAVVDTVPTSPSFSVAQLREFVKVTCPDKNFDDVTDAQITTVIAQELTKTFALETAEQQQARIVNAVCNLGKSKNILSQVPTPIWLAVGALGIFALTKV